VFAKKSSQSWSDVRNTATTFEEQIKRQWPLYHEELRGVAAGSDNDILDIVALNVRTEIAFGQFSDGCTSVSWHGEKRAWLGQNWDWMVEQKENLVVLRIAKGNTHPGMVMVTEAGIIGKIGFNDRGVGTCLNAIKAKGCDFGKLPVHLALRMALESDSAADAAAKLEQTGIASSAHILIADEKEAIGLEFTITTFARLPMSKKGTILHSNHLLADHQGVFEPSWLVDSPVRVERMEQLTDNLAGMVKEPSWQEFSALFDDESNYPTSICRKREGQEGIESLFGITMDLKSKKGIMKLGRPVKPDQILDLVCI
jgi:isopenicillin-N N-acyltransferase-like protein